ncbi:DMT family transporter [Ureibacillus aquaedulcis]|uniref:DMT family transporter n=1 Tax=Ureibacillus aquaedulcis TaxID=3058421 RepID=A0ABT8GN48_9BACL|nr:DMT family transporter [Ureibacillus sp. BA0131]MDN4492843.1 DMT family transporter [Ureibacillus sp. BA0131]
MGIILAILSGFFISLQNVTNATIGSEVGTWTTAMITQAAGATGAFIIYLFSKKEHTPGLKKVKPLYLFGGSFGAIVVASSVIAVSYVGATISNSLILLAQLGMVIVIEALGIFDINKQQIAGKQWVGLALMMLGAVFISL